MDKYKNFHELQAWEQEDDDFRIVTRVRNDSRTVILAPHGGAIEPGTSELAQAVAAQDMNLAIFEGIKSRGNSDLHITSTNFDEPRCVRLVAQSDFVLTLHGERSADRVVYIGGADTVLGSRVAAALTAAGYDVRQHQSLNLQGRSPQNICNRGRRNMGVQLELTRGLRAAFFSSLTAEGRQSETSDFHDFAATLRRGLQPDDAF